jgi:hypothetical protein
MLTSAELEVEKGMNPHIEAKMRTAHRLIIGQFRDRFNEDYSRRAPCIEVANDWIALAHCPPLRFTSALALFDKPTPNKFDIEETGILLLTGHHPDDSQIMLAIDPRAWAWGFIPIGLMPAVAGRKTYVEEVLTDAYAKVARGTKITIPFQASLYPFSIQPKVKA